MVKKKEEETAEHIVPVETPEEIEVKEQAEALAKAEIEAQEQAEADAKIQAELEAAKELANQAESDRNERDKVKPELVEVSLKGTSNEKTGHHTIHLNPSTNITFIDGVAKVYDRHAKELKEAGFIE